MRRLIFALVALASIISCSPKEDNTNPYIKDLCYGGGWNAYTGETYDVEEFITVGGAPISMGVSTKKLASAFHFSQNGTGTRYVTYFASKGNVANYLYDYASFDFTWEISGSLVTITNSKKDSIIPERCTIDIVAFYSDRFTGKYDGVSMSFLDDIAWLNAAPNKL